MLVVIVAVLGIALVVQILPGQSPASGEQSLVSNWTLAAMFAIATTICWTMFATYVRLVELGASEEPEPRIFSRSTSINPLLLERATEVSRGTLHVQCHGDRGFAGLLYDDGLQASLSNLIVRICDVGVAAQVDRTGISALVQHLQQQSSEAVKIEYLDRRPSTRIALLRDRAANPVWLSVSFYGSQADGLTAASSSPTLVFTQFGTEDSTRMLRFAEQQLGIVDVA